MQRQESVSDSEEEDRALIEKTKEKEKKEKKPSCLRSSSLKTPIVNTSTTTRTWSVPQNTLLTHFEHTLNLPEDMPKI